MAFEVFAQTIKDKYLGATIISILLFLYIFWVATFFPSVKPEMAMYDQLLQNPGFKVFIGDLTSMSTFTGFIAAEVFSIIGILLGAYVAFLTASFVAGEIEQKSSELMLSLPASREKVLLSRFAVLLPITVAIVIAMLLAVVLGADYIGESIDLMRLADGMAFMAAFMLAVGGLSLFLSSLMSNGRNASFASIGVLLAMFLVENIGSEVTSIDWARNFSLFHYADISSIIADTSVQVDWANCIILLVIAVVFLALATIAYKRRDINLN